MFTLATARRSQGFTLPEIILVVAVLSILVSVTAAPLYQFMRQRDVQAETNAQNDLRKALATYIENTRELPTDTITNTTADWYAKLAPYANGLSPQQIRFDTWGNERRYVMSTTTQNLVGNNVPIYYATITSAGANGIASSKICGTSSGIFTNNNAVGGAINGYRDATDACWWKNQTNPSTAYTTFGTAVGGSPTDDDLMLKFTDYQAKMDKYQLTLDRLNKISDALQSYAQQQYANAVAAGVTNATQFVYYPWASTTDTQTSSEYAAQVLADTANYNSGSNSLASLSTTTSLRRVAMVNLMHLLGLPDEMCCNALDTFTDTDGATKEIPFYYTSNPRPRLGASCGSRPNPTATSTLPARVSTADPTAIVNGVAACY